MDPYLQSYWGDVHTRLMVYLSDQLQPQLPPELSARVEEVVRVVDESADERDGEKLSPDLFVTEREQPSGFGVGPAATVTLDVPVAEPLVVSSLRRTERHIKIVDTRDHDRLITAIEVLSPGNKTGPENRALYKEKQRQYLRAGANLVEIDLVRGGDYVLCADRLDVPEEWLDHYLICVSRATTRKFELYPAWIREPLPNFRIPLRPGDPDAVVQLQQVIDACYAAGRYRNRIDYTVPPRPKLPPEERELLQQLLEAAAQ